MNGGDNPVPGEIIAWKRESGLVAHRVVRIFEKENQTFFITRGDSSAHEDQPVIKDQIAGKVIRIELTDGKPVPLATSLKKKHTYFINRLLVWMILHLNQFKRMIMSSFSASLLMWPGMYN